MNIRRMNESFDKKFKEHALIESSVETDLANALRGVVNALMHKGETSVKAYEVALQDEIEKFYPDKAWWEVTDCNIFSSLLSRQDPKMTVMDIMANLKKDIDEGYELLDGTKVELYRDYDKAVARAKELGLKEAEYGDAYGVSYCMWNTSGDRNEDEEVIAYYKFEGRKPRPLTDDEAERIANEIGVRFEDFDDVNESLKEDSTLPYVKWVKRVDDGKWHMWGGSNSKEPDGDFLYRINHPNFPNKEYNVENQYSDVMVLPAGEEPKDNVKESLSSSERREFISKMTKALMDDKFGYSREEANDIAIKRADALGDDWRVRWGGDIDKEIKQELATTLSKADYEVEYGKANESLKEDNGRIIKFNYTNGGEHFVGYTVQGELDKIDKQNDYFWFTDDKSDIKNGQVLHGWTLPAYLIDRVKDERVMRIIADESLKEGHTWGDTTIEDYVEKNFSGDDESKQKLIDWFVSLDYTNQFGFKDISVKDIFKKANEFGLSRKYSAIESKLKEGKRGFVRKYKGCSIHDAGDVFVCTNEHGLNIGQSRTESGCEGLIDEYIKNKGAKNESKLSERNLTKAERHNRDMDRIFANKKKFDDKYANFLKDKGYSDEQIKKLRDADDLSGEIARKFTPDGEQPSAILGKILKESQSQELARYYRELKDENGFDVARLADAFYKTPEWKEIGFQGDVLFTEKGWDAFKKWAKETKNVDIKDLGSSDDFLGEGRLNEKQWRYTLENGNALRDAIESEDILGILATLQLCYQELNEAGLIDDDDCDRWVQDIDDIDTEDATYDDIDWELDQFYDLCDNIGVWIPINEEKCNEGTKKVGKSINREVANDIEYYYSIPKDDTLKYLKINKIVLTDDDWSDGNYDKLVDDIANKVMDNFWQLDEDTVKQGSQWVNKGKEGTHGKFKTKKEADAQRKAMYANGFGEGKECVGEDFSVKIDWDDIEFELDAELGNADVTVEERNPGFAKFDIEFEDGFRIRGNLIGNPQQITVGVPALNTKKTCRDTYEIAEFIRSLKN